MQLPVGFMLPTSLPNRQLHVQSLQQNTIARCEICSKLTLKTSERRHLRRSGVFIVNSEHISHLVLLFLLLTLRRQMPVEFMLIQLRSIQWQVTNGVILSSSNFSTVKDPSKL